MPIIIREAGAADAHDMAVVRAESWRAAYRGIIPDEVLDNMNVAESAEKFKKRLAENSENFWDYVAVFEGKVVGILHLCKSRDEDKPDAGEVGAIYFFKEYWGMGFGRKMMERAVETLRAKGFGEIILWVLRENRRSRRFYEKCGFAFDGTEKDITIGKPLPEVRYSMVL